MQKLGELKSKYKFIHYKCIILNCSTNCAKIYNKLQSYSHLRAHEDVIIRLKHEPMPWVCITLSPASSFYDLWPSWSDLTHSFVRYTSHNVFSINTKTTVI